MKFAPVHFGLNEAEVKKVRKKQNIGKSIKIEIQKCFQCANRGKQGEWVRWVSRGFEFV